MTGNDVLIGLVAVIFVIAMMRMLRPRKRTPRGVQCPTCGARLAAGKPPTTRRRTVSAHQITSLRARKGRR